MSNFVGLQLKIAAMKKISLLLFSAMLVLASCDKMPSKMYNDYFENDFTISDIEMKSAVVSYVAHYPQDTDGYSFKVLVSEDPTPTKDNSREYSCTTSDRKNYSASITGLWGEKHIIAVHVSGRAYTLMAPLNHLKLRNGQRRQVLSDRLWI